jgi:hypothetical protein
MTEIPETDGVVSPKTCPVNPAKPRALVSGVARTLTLSPNVIRGVLGITCKVV